MTSFNVNDENESFVKEFYQKINTYVFFLSKINTYVMYLFNLFIFVGMYCFVLSFTETYLLINIKYKNYSIKWKHETLEQI